MLTIALPATPAQAETFTGRETLITDGDTFRMNELRVRVGGIDAPESGEPGADAATRALAALMAGQDVTSRIHDWDRYGRAVGQCWAGGGDVAAVLSGRASQPSGVAIREATMAPVDPRSWA